MNALEYAGQLTGVGRLYSDLMFSTRLGCMARPLRVEFPGAVYHVTSRGHARHGSDDPLHLVVEIKSYRRADAKEMKSTMDTYWVPGVNHLGTYGRWAFAEFTDVYQIEADFKAKVETEFKKVILQVTGEKD